MAGYVLGDPLFCTNRLSEILGGRSEDAVREASSIDSNEILQRPPDVITEEIFAKYRVPPTRLDRDGITGRVDETVVDVRGDFLRAVIDRSRPANVPAVQIAFHVPFEGPNVFHCQANRFGASVPRASIVERSVIIGRSVPYDVLRDQRESVVEEINRVIDQIEERLEWIKSDIEQWEPNLRTLVERAVDLRRANVLELQDTEVMLGVPIERNREVSATYSVPSLPRRQNIRATPKQTFETFNPEPAISDEDFCNIILDIGKVLSMFERFPVVHSQASEEHLRDQIIVALNAIYGAGSAESFSKRGKTDIFLPWEDNAVFIAECKWWRGPAQFSEKALPQLLDRYIVWRDTHTAMVLFIKNKDASAVIATAAEAIRAHPRYVRDSESVGVYETFVLHQEDDEDRRLRLALLPAVICP